MSTFPITRMRRLRYKAGVRQLVQETQLSVNDLVLPLFIHHDDNLRTAIPSMPGHYQLGLKQLAEEIETIKQLNIPAVVLFGIPKQKKCIR